VAVTVGEAREKFTTEITAMASAIRTGSGLDKDVQMGPVITAASKVRIASLIAQGESEGGTVVLDGRQGNGAIGGNGNSRGNFLRPTVIDDVPEQSALFTTEIFGPVLSLLHAATVEEGIALLARSPYGNMASIFTTSGAAARKFRYEVPAGNIGVNIGVAAPMAYFPFSGWRDSFFGVLHGQGRDAIDFYTDKKVVVERWPQEWSRTF
jgi:malonate-semialdehyde dehydrogenase (acetylating)/methylmalonate-semialdehyde dehydrogenase